MCCVNFSSHCGPLTTLYLIQCYKAFDCGMIVNIEEEWTLKEEVMSWI
jgi:hypothetical protein